jgi:hypothetical protein
VGGETGTFVVVLAAALFLLLVSGVLPRAVRRVKRRARRRFGRSLYPPPNAAQFDEFHRLVEDADSGTADAEPRAKYRSVASRRRVRRTRAKRGR